MKHIWHAWKQDIVPFALIYNPLGVELYSHRNPIGCVRAIPAHRRRLRVSDDPEFGIRIPVGLAYLFADIPVDIFAELAPVVNITSDTGFDLTGGIRARYYFR